MFVPVDPTVDERKKGGKVEPLHRHRAKVIPGPRPRPQIYADPRSARWEEYVAEVALKQVLESPVVVEVGDPKLAEFTLPREGVRAVISMRFNLPKPKSYPNRIVWHTKKPDLDNYAKGVVDGLVKGRLLADDGCITDEINMKRYVEPGHPEGVEVELILLPAEVI